MPDGWKKNIQIMRRRDLKNIQIPYRQLPQEEIEKKYTPAYVREMLARANQSAVEKPVHRLATEREPDE